MEKALHGDALAEYEAFEKLSTLYRQDAIDAFIEKYPMFKEYRHYLRCRRTFTDYEECEVTNNVLFEIEFDGEVTLLHAIAMSNYGALRSYNHKMSEMKTVSLAKPAFITVRLELKRFFYSPLSGRIMSF